MVRAATVRGSTWSPAICTAVQLMTRPVTAPSLMTTSSTLTQLNIFAPAPQAREQRVDTASTASAV